VRSLSLVLLFVATASASAAAAERYRIDPEHTTVLFMTEHYGLSRMIGRFNRIEGNFVLDRENPSASSVAFGIDAGSIDTNHSERDAHLRSPDFFNVAEFPHMIFRSTEIEVTGPDTARVTGDFTLLGVTRPVTMAVTFNGTRQDPFDPGITRAGFSARGTLRRSDFGMTYELDLIGDTVDLVVETEGTR